MGSGYQFDPVTPPPRPRPRVLDVMFSTLFAGGASFLAIETDMFYPRIVINKNSPDGTETTILSPPPPPQWVSKDIPLVPGRSIVAETLCQPLTEEFRNFPKKLWQSGNHRVI